MAQLGIYVHVPFCRKKCGYCDFFSVCTLKSAEDYASAVLRDMERFRERGQSADTLYFGGGTPTELPADLLRRLVSSAREIFSIDDSAEITVETNPGETVPGLFEGLRRCGVNRLSVGMQSACENELEFLGRGHSPEQASETVGLAKAEGFQNISLDLMLGIPFQTRESLERSVDFAASLGVSHVSAYILKVEEGTRFALLQKKGELPLCDEDFCAESYLYACELLEQYGFMQYEISNFSKPGFESRHNLKYWRDEEYLGFGPSAHSFFEGKRFFYKRNLAEYIKGAAPVFDGDGGGAEEYIMLGLRLCEGLDLEKFEQKFGFPFKKTSLAVAKELALHGLVAFDGKKIALTRQGFLLSNEIISRLI